MKKVFIVFMLLALPGISASSFANDSFDQLQQSADDGNSAVNSYSNGSYDYEGASHNASHNFDTPSDSAPAVDLSGAGEHPTPALLRNSDGSNPYTPQEYRSLHTTPPPPLP